MKNVFNIQRDQNISHLNILNYNTYTHIYIPNMQSCFERIILCKVDQEKERSLMIVED